MTFQQHTTYEQSVRLKELGMDQRLDADGLYFDEQPPRQVWRGIEFDDDEQRVRAFSRQELEDFLMERYDLSIQHTPGACRCSYGFGPSRADLELYTKDDGVRDGSDPRFRYPVWPQKSERDPFPAIFAAVIWTLEQEQSA